jgi:hypothetical protein
MYSPRAMTLQAYLDATSAPLGALVPPDPAEALVQAHHLLLEDTRLLAITTFTRSGMTPPRPQSSSNAATASENGT